jgi:hypothetical protein
MRTVAALLIIFAASSASARWVVCDSKCAVPAVGSTASGLSSLPLYKGTVRFGGEVKEGGTVRWLWLRVDPPPTCSQAQLANLQDRVYGCSAKVGEVLLLTERVRQAP